MFTWGSKYLFGVSAFSLLGAILYGLATGGGIIGVISAGYKAASASTPATRSWWRLRW